MSYVLDALRRAESERHRGDLPGLHSQPLGAGAGPTPAAPGGAPRGALVGLAAAAALLLLALAAWWLLPRTAAGEHPETRAGITTAPAATPEAAASVSAASVSAVPQSAPPPPAATALPPVPAPAPAPTPVPTPVPATPVPATPAPPAATPRLAELPEALRRALPALAFGGAVDSPQPAHRMLIINGQVFREGEQPAPGLTLLTIRLRSAVFDFRGQRFEAGY